LGIAAAAMISATPAWTQEPEPAPVRTVVAIDPGHGGDDPGAYWAAGPAEKVMVLELAKDLQKMLQKNPDWEVVLTRSRDQRETMLERQEFCNRKQARVLVSLHMVAPAAGRTQVAYFYYGHFVRDEPLAALAAKEAAAGVHVIPWDLAQNPMLKSSRKLGEALSLAWDAAGLDPAGTKASLQAAPLRLLTGVRCPAVVVEISGADTVKTASLSTAAYRLKAASALAAGLESFLGRR
jgi:N-acetylmuramoyl-L-alanine amidase